MRERLSSLRLNVKVFLLGAGGVLLTAVALVLLAAWQSAQYGSVAQGEVEGLLDSDLDHITTGVFNLVQAENDAVQELVDSHLRVARHLLEAKGQVSLSPENSEWTAVNQYTGESLQLRVPRLLLAKEAGWESPLVDSVTALVGETATVLQRMNPQGDMLRIATTVRDSGGKRAIGTFIPAKNPDGSANPVIAAVLRGETYHGRAYVVNDWYLTAYEPMYDAQHTLVGMLYVGVQQKAVAARLRQAILNARVGKTGYVYVLGAKGEERGHYIISYRGERDGENIWDNKDSDGQYVIRSIIEKATGLQPGQLSTVRYRWQNPGEPAPRWKIARLAYYAPWDWVLGTSVYEDELQSYRSVLKSGQRRMTTIMGLAGILIVLVVGAASLVIARTIARPVQQMTRAVDTLLSGNLDQPLVVQSDDEIGVLAKAFNSMAEKLKTTLQGLRQSEEKYRSIFENALEGVFQTSLEGRFLSANPAMAQILGYDSPEQLISSVEDLRSQLHVDPKQRDSFVAGLREHGEVRDREVQLYHKSGRPLWVSLSARLIQGAGSASPIIAGFLIDISERKQAQERLGAANRRFENVFEFLPDATLIVGADNRIVGWNRAIEEMTGVPKDKMLGLDHHEATRLFYGEVRKSLIDLLEVDDPELATKYSFVRRRGTALFAEAYTPALRGGRGAYVWAIASPLISEDGTVLGSIESIRDITDRKQAEQAMQESEEKYRKIVDTANEGVWVLDDVGKTTLVNARMASMIGYRPEEILCRPLADFLFEQDRPDHYEKLEARRRGIAGSYERRFRCKDGRALWTLASGAPMLDAQGRFYGAFAMFTDITERKRAEEAERAANERFRSVLRASTAYAIIGIDSKGTIQVFNEGAERMLGYAAQEVVDQASIQILHDPAELAARARERGVPEGIEVLVAQARRGIVDSADWTYVRKDGSRVAVVQTVTAMRSEDRTLTGFIAIARDTTKEKQLEAQLLQSQRMETVGLLAGGIAHDFNNLLTPILGYTEMLLSESRSRDSQQGLQQIKIAAERARDLTRQLLAFSRKQMIELRTVDLSELLSRFHSVLRRTIRENVKIEIRRSSSPCLVRADAGQIEQVLLNLSINAQDAMPDGGVLTIDVEPVDLDAESAEIHPGIDPGPQVLLAVSDTGMGMDAETAQHVFEPFFTTKELGKGTGLGLSTVYGIVKQHGGGICLYTELQHGSTFKVFLPRASQPESLVSPPRTSVPAPAKGSETVLVVEDDEVVRTLVARVLSRLGYQVLVSDNADLCEQMVTSKNHPVDLLLTDVVMPETNGKQLFERLRKLRPRLKVLFMSGYASSVIGRHGVLDESVSFLQKPFSIQMLSEKVREVLDESGSSSSSLPEPGVEDLDT